MEDWIGREEIREDVAHPGPVAALAALLDYEHPPWHAGTLPPLAHWLYFPELARESDLSDDGHPRRGRFLPPVSLPRRMWAGSSIEFHTPIKLGAQLRRCSCIEDVTEKAGRSGRLIFVRLRHDIETSHRLALREWQDIVYREAETSSVPQQEPADQLRSETSRQMTADSRLLFRYSALTFNAHRIHYDRDYSRSVEGYPGLVVHGPLLATLLLDHALRMDPRLQVARFSFRARLPVFDTSSFELCLAHGADHTRLWIRGPGGATAMTAQLNTV
ncbi:MAG: MaoC family dehydratase N-terminal domain-containing protein [Alphaproteobacteria bacterium]|nr:MaoC family dehydratase N-terminal domain-containing protein [Alphaproteobacteria bacterium]